MPRMSQIACVYRVSADIQFSFSTNRSFPAARLRGVGKRAAK